MRGNVAEQVVQSPDPSCKLRLRKYPPASKPAKPVRFCQAAGGDEFGSKVKGRAMRTIEQSFEINLVNQHARPDSPRDLANLAERFVVDKSAAGIVHIGDHDEPGAICYDPFHLVRINTKAFLEAALESLHAGAEISGRR